MALASPMFAQEAGGAAPAMPTGRAAAYIAMGIASGLCGLGQGRATASAAEAMARNPGAIAAIRVALILGLVLIESLALYTLVITFIAQVSKSYPKRPAGARAPAGLFHLTHETSRNLHRSHNSASITTAKSIQEPKSSTTSAS